MISKITSSAPDRVELLDWLRGFMATSIMLYHLTFWHIKPLDSSSLLGRLGIYGVSIFFILSGLSMAVVYSKFICNFRTSLCFLIRRIFRIWPLLWLCILYATLATLFKGDEVYILKVFLNLTTLFGLFAPGSYLNTGAWSIGNEVFYYTLTPVILYLYNKSLIKGNAFLLLTLLIFIIFSFYLLKPFETLSNQWEIYINPLNNLFLYTAGIAIYYNFHNQKIKYQYVLTVFIIAILFFSLYPLEGDQIVITTGINRLLFSAASIAIVIFFYQSKIPTNTPKLLRFSLGTIGTATYGIYLLHPIINAAITHTLKSIGFGNVILTFILVAVFTFFTAIAVFYIFEEKFIRLGKKLTNKYLYRNQSQSNHYLQ